MRKARKHYTAEEKVAILRRHLLDKESVSKLCDELARQPTVFYRWQKEFFENGAAAFQTNNRGRRQPEQERIERLERKIQTKDEVLAELMAEHMALKKTLGNSDQNMDAGGHAGGPPKPDPRRPRPQAGAGSTATSATPSAGGLSFGVTMALPGETEAGFAGKQPCRGIARRAHRDDDHGRGGHLSRSSQSPIGSKDPDALKIPARRAASTLTRSARSPVPAEPVHVERQASLRCLRCQDSGCVKCLRWATKDRRWPPIGGPQGNGSVKKLVTVHRASRKSLINLNPAVGRFRTAPTL